MPEPNAAPAAEQPTDFEAWDKLPEAEQDALITAKPADAVVPAKADPPAKEDPPAKVDPPAKDDEDYESLPAWAKKRIARQTTKIRDLQAAADIPKPAVAAAAATVVPAAVAAAAGVDGAPVLPKFSDFPGDLEAYDAALLKAVAEITRYTAKQVRAEEQQAETAKTQKAADDVRLDAWSKQVEASNEEHDDFDEIALNPKLPVTNVMLAVMQASENGSELLYHLGEHPELSASIAAMSGPAAALALGKLDAKLFPEGDAGPKKVASISRAPKPVKPVGGGGGADTGKEPDLADFVAWNKWADKQEAAKAA